MTDANAYPPPESGLPPTFIQTADATLVARKSEAQRVQELVDLLRDNGLEKYL